MKKLKTVLAVALAVCLVVPGAIMLVGCSKFHKGTVVGNTYKYSGMTFNFVDDEEKKLYLDGETQEECEKSAKDLEISLIFKTKTEFAYKYTDPVNGTVADYYYYDLNSDNIMIWYQDEQKEKRIFNEEDNVEIVVSKNFRTISIIEHCKNGGTVTTTFKA